MANKTKTVSKSTNSRRSSPKRQRSSPKEQRSVKTISRFAPLRCKRFTGHQFREYRKRRGLLIKKMRKSRGLPQGAIGAPSQVRLYESGKAAQIVTQEILVRLVPCPREMLKFWKNDLEHIPVACVNCRKICPYKGQDEEKMIEAIMADITDFDLE